MHYFPVIYSSLSAQALLDYIIDCYQLPIDCKIQFLKRGFNDTYLISTVSNRYIVRVYKHNWRTINSIENEIDLLNFLSDNKIKVAKPIIDKTNSFIQTINAPEGIRYIVLFSYAEGSQIRKLTAEQSNLLGIATGKIHALTQKKTYSDYAFNYTVDYQFENTISVLSSLLADFPEKINYLITLKKEFASVFSKINSSEIINGICHGDLQAENFHIENNNITFFDFDFFGHGPLIYDIGVFMWYDQKNKTPEIIRAFLNGYQTERKLTDTEVKMLPYFSTLRAIFQMTLFCKVSNGSQLPLWPIDQVADFIGKIERWHKKASS